MEIKKNKICFVVSTLYTIRVFLDNHIRQLSESFDVFIVANLTEKDWEYLQTLPIKGYKHIGIERKIHFYQDLKSLIYLIRYFKKEKFFAIHSVTPKAGLITAVAGKFVGVKNRIHIFTGQVWHTKHGAFKQLLILLDKIIVTLNTHILIDGESQRQFLIKNKIIKENSSFVLGKGSISGVNIQRFNPSVEIREQFRRDLNLDDKIVFGFLGRLCRDKGIINLFDAFNKLCGELTNVYLLIIGTDEENMLPLLPNYSNIIDNKNFTFYGITLEPEKILQALDVYCLPSYREGFGTSVLEASCLGIPIICSDTYGLMDGMVDGVTGLRHKVGQSQDLFEKMKILADNNNNTREAMGKNAREFVTKNFSGVMITNEWVNFYRQLSN